MLLGIVCIAWGILCTIGIIVALIMRVPVEHWWTLIATAVLDLSVGAFVIHRRWLD